MNTEKYLPIGSVVTIENYDKEVMIIGYIAYSKDNPSQIVSGEYIGIPLEEGYKEDNKILFNKENITNVIFMGYKNIQVINRLKTLDETLKMLKNSNSAEDFINEMYAKSVNQKTNSNAYSKVESTIIKEKDNE